MGKLINEPIFPVGVFHDVPLGFIWRGRRYEVAEVGGEWRTLGRWWEGEGERRYVRILTPAGLALDLCHDMKTGLWMLHELQD